MCASEQTRLQARPIVAPNAATFEMAFASLIAGLGIPSRLSGCFRASSTDQCEARL